MLNTLDILHSYVLYNGMVPGKIENYSTVIDFSGVKMTEIPFTSFAKMTIHIKDGYFARCITASFIHAPSVIQMASRFIFTFLSEFHTQSIGFFIDEYKPKFKKVFGLKNVQKKYGGKLPNKSKDFFPPVLQVSKPVKTEPEPACETKIDQIDEL